jgi:hypothetical protein
LKLAAITTHSCFIGGDMNIDISKKSPLESKLTSWLVDTGLLQHVTNFTRHRAVALSNGTTRVETSIIDHVYSNVTCTIEQYHSEFSDHEIIAVVSEKLTLTESKRIKISVRDWRNYGQDKIQKQIEKVGGISPDRLEIFLQT